ncbi:MAG: CoA pyrophosphatase [Pseudomonadota bacterium]
MTLAHLKAFDFSTDGFRTRVEQRFRSRADVMAAVGGDHVLNPDYAEQLSQRTFKPAAVLICAFERDGEAWVLLTKRTDHLSNHKGQIAFPGGRIDGEETPVEAALREANEEVGLHDGDIHVLGAMGKYYSGSGYLIHPVLAVGRDWPQLTLSPAEVADAFFVPLSFLMNADNHVTESKHFKGNERFFYAIPYDDDGVERHIWGVTAGIIHTVQERLYGG